MNWVISRAALRGTTLPRTYEDQAAAKQIEENKEEDDNQGKQEDKFENNKCDDDEEDQEEDQEEEDREEDREDEKQQPRSNFGSSGMQGSQCPAKGSLHDWVLTMSTASCVSTTQRAP